MRERLLGIDTHDVGMRMRRADDMGMQRADRDRKIVGIAAAPRQQRRIFLTPHRFAELIGHASSPDVFSTAPGAGCQPVDGSTNIAT